MHISEGVLSAPVLLTGAALTAVGTAVGLKKMDYDQLPLVGVLSATFFVASLIHLPAGAVSVHLVLNGFCGLLLGWMAFPAVLVGLALQAVLFQYGGLTVLGVTTFNIAFPAVVLGFVCRKGVLSENVTVRVISAFDCGAGSVLLAGVCVCIALLATEESFWANAYSVLVFHVPVMIIEGVVTVFCVEFVRKVSPGMLRVYS